MLLKLLGLIFSLALTSCASNVPLSSAADVTSSGAKLNFLDISKFDNDLSNTLQNRNTLVEVAFFEKVSPNNLPDRLQKWISVVEVNGGKVLVDPPPNELVARSPFAALSLLGSLISSIKGLAKFNSEKIYETAKGRDVVISLERNSSGEVVIKTIKFIKGTK